MEKTVNWILVALGGLLIIAEVLLGAASGFDFALMGTALVLGGVLGLVFASTKVGLISGGALAFLYLAVLRRGIRSRLMGKDRPSNVDALIGRTGVVTARIADHAPGSIKLGDELWRASLSPSAAATPREPGEEVIVESVDGVTLIVR
jgi:membrane protein implicated in regulation of membrane protease activity